MNSLYGKFGMKPEGTKVDILDHTNPTDAANLAYILNTLGETIKDFFEIDNHMFVIRSNVERFSYNEHEDVYHGLDVNIAIASSITAGVELE